MKRILFILLALAFLTGCTKGKSTPTLAPFTTDKIPVLKPVGSNFEIVDCSTFDNQQANPAGPTPVFDNDNDNNNDAGSTQCGYLTVPEDRRLPDGPTIKIAVTIHVSASPTRLPDPIVIIGGSFSMGHGRYFGRLGAFDEMTPDRDIIMFDVRGMGHSQPSYTCPQYPALYSDTTSENTTSSQWENAYIEASRACRTQLEAAGMNLSAYTSASVAADLEDLRQALGYSQWNVYASSYGTRIAFTLMRNAPQSLRSVILDSPWPLQVDTFAEQAVNAEQVLNTLFRYCSEDEQCNKYYPMLKDYLYEDVDALNARPITVHTANLNSGALLDIVVDGNRLLDFVLSLVSSPRTEQLFEVPRMIYQLHDGKTEVISRLLGQSNPDFQPGGGVEQLIQCNDEAGANTGAASGANVDIRIQKYFETITDANIKACEAWNTGTPAATGNEPVSSSAPTLLLAGELNWRIPASWATLAAQTLSHSYAVTFPGAGQAITFSRSISDCSNVIMKAFLTEPSVQPDIQCASTKPTFIWITLP